MTQTQTLQIQTPIETERWASHPDYPDYIVSTHGRICSFKRGRPVMLKPGVSRNGYLTVILTNEARRKTFHVHTLVLSAHAGPRAEGWETRHLNGNQLDNRLENLAWGTKKQNAADRIQHGTQVTGERNGMARLTEAQVIEARELRSMGVPNKVLAAYYGVAASTMSHADQRQDLGSPGARAMNRYVAAVIAVSWVLTVHGLWWLAVLWWLA